MKFNVKRFMDLISKYEQTLSIQFPSQLEGPYACPSRPKFFQPFVPYQKKPMCQHAKTYPKIHQSSPNLHDSRQPVDTPTPKPTNGKNENDLSLG